jgi:hypothetical protein
MATEDEMLRDSMMAGSGIVPAEEPEPKPKPSYRIRSVDPKMGDIDEQFAMIETDKAYGAPASDPTMRRIVVGDELPEGSVTAITPEGIRVIPDYEGSEEYVIPLGAREGYKPPVREKKQPDTLYDNEGLRWFGKELESRHWEEEREQIRQQAVDRYREDQMKFFEGDDAIDPDEVSEMVGAQFERSFEDDKTLEMTQTPEGMAFLFQDEDGNLSSYIKIDETGEVIRMTPEPGAVDTYGTTQSPREQFAMTPLEEILEMAKIRAAADSL